MCRSGKSSMMVALFRMEKLRAGVICVDGIDIAKVPAKTLRSKIGIIPQVSCCCLRISNIEKKTCLQL